MLTVDSVTDTKLIYIVMKKLNYRHIKKASSFNVNCVVLL